MWLFQKSAADDPSVEPVPMVNARHVSASRFFCTDRKDFRPHERLFTDIAGYVNSPRSHREPW
jgi:hypothetical protein